jgi:periplasmic protein CpxP/Spy
MFRFTHSAARAASLTTLLGAIAFAGPLFAASGDLSHPKNTGNPFAPRMILAQASSPEEMGGASKPESAKGGESPVEARIKELHKKLRITPAQETQWNNLAQVMRENARTMQDLERKRAEDVKTISAVDVIKSYADVIEAHEAGMKKFIPAFEDLYSSLSAEQKKIADDLFRSRASAAAKKETKANQ